jgi:hypothetical protein
MPILLSDEELEALAGLPHLHRCLYIFGIRRYMDYQIGITGIKRKISYKSLAEDIYVNPRCGVSNTGSNSRDQIKRALIVLEETGLIKRKSIVTKDEKQLILECLLAQTDKSIQNKAAPLPPHSPALQAAPVENSKNPEKIDTEAVDKQESRPASRPAQNEKAARHPVSGKLNNNRRQQFLDLFTGKRFPAAYLIDARTNHMLNLWESANITIDEAVEAIQHGDNEILSRQGRVTVPWYYQDIPFQLRNDLNHLQEKTNATTTTRQSKQRVTYDHLRERRAKWREKCEQEEQDGREDDRNII